MQAARLELQRARQLHCYFPQDTTASGVRPPDENPGGGPAWQSYSALMHPLLDKSPWLAAWDRLLRTLLRFDLRSGGLQGDSHLRDLYEGACRGAEALGEPELEAALKAWGFSKSEILEHVAAAAALSAAAAAAAAASAGADKGKGKRGPLTAGLQAAAPREQSAQQGGAKGGGKGGGKTKSVLGLAMVGDVVGEEVEVAGGGAAAGVPIQLSYEQFVQLMMLGVQQPAAGV